jgi:hypothetical protein
MRRIRQVLQLHFSARISARLIALEVGVGRSTVQDYVARATGANLSWPLPPDLTDASLELLLFFSTIAEIMQRPTAELTWGPEPLTAEQRRDLLEIVEDRYQSGSLIITSQVPVERWYEIVGDPTLADAILDRLVHNAHRIELKGESLRKKRADA